MVILRTSLVLFICLVLTTLGVLYAARQQPADASIADIDFCDGHICVLGITPKLTSAQEAAMRLRDNASLKPIGIVGDQAVKQTQPFYEIELYTDEGASFITQIDLILPSVSQLTASLIVAKFGSPCAVTVAQSRLMVFTYPGMDVYFAITPYSSTGRLEFTAKVTYMMFNTSTTPQNCGDWITAHDKLPWRGFRRY